MNIVKEKLLKARPKKCQKVPGSNIKATPSAASDNCCQWLLSPLAYHEKKKSSPKDVPKGHFVVYVGEHHKRFVIKISILKHPLFQALLDHAHEVYDFTATSKLYIPCDENIFLCVVRCATSPQTNGSVPASDNSAMKIVIKFDLIS